MRYGRWSRLVGFIVLLVCCGFVASASAGDGVTYTATQTIPVPPASNYAGAGGGDGWAVAMTPTAVYNVFHHNSYLTVSCHLQVDASPCWTGELGSTRTITVNDRTSGFAVSGQPGLWIDQPTGHLYLFGTRNSDSTGGVVCIDTAAAPTSSNPFCGFTELTAAGESPGGSSSYLSNGAAVGSRLYAFNYVSGAGVSGAKNTMLCFDIETFKACSGQPFPVAIGDGTVSATNYPSPSVVPIGGQVIVPIQVGNTYKLACFDGATTGNCGGSWPVTLNFGYPSSNGAAFPLLNADGGIQGLCLPSSGAPCFTLSGASAPTPDGLAAAIVVPIANDGWNGPAFVLGPRVYVPNGNTNKVHCYDYNLKSGCANFPKSFNNLGYLYTVNTDPQRPTCIWVNADNGSQQIQNFDAFTGGACGEGPIRVLASSSVVSTPLCTPGSWKSLQITAPARGTYESGSIAFQDSSGTPIPGAANVQLDGTGTANLTGLDLSKGAGLPQFLITLNGSQGTPGSVGVALTWTGTFDQSCETKPGTTVVNPPSGGPVNPPSGGPVIPPKADVKVTLTSPTERRTNDSVTFTANLQNNGPDAATGIVARTPIPAGAKLLTVAASRGNGCTGGAIATCYVGSLGAGQSVTMTIVLSSPAAQTLNLTTTAESDYDPDHSNNIASTSTTVLAPGAVPPPPPPSAQPGTFNAVGTGTILVNGVPHAADEQFVLKSGDVVDVTNGIITFTDSDGHFASFSGTQLVAARRTSSAGGLKLSASSSADTTPASFQIDQAATAGALTTLSLVGGDDSICNSPRTVATKSQKPIRQLWGSAKGSFRTKGRYSAATVRGTIWLVQDRCDGTLTQVVQGVVEVVDATLNKTVSVGPGKSYLAPSEAPRKAFTPPASTRQQTPAQIVQRGLSWGGRVFKTKSRFSGYLASRGASWQGFAKKYPAAAAALQKRK